MKPNVRRGADKRARDERRRLAQEGNARSESRFLRTFEDWYPAYAEPVTEDLGANGATPEALENGDGYLKASLLFLTSHEWRVCVWGLDDFGMERDFAAYDDAKAAYDALTEPVIRAELSERGFKTA